VPSELLERRPDIAAAERRVAAANAQIGVAVAAFYPTITLNASSGFESSSLAKWFTAARHFWSVGPGISETVFDGGLRAAQTDAARAAYDATVASYRQTVLGAFQGVEDNLAALRILEQERGVEDEAVKAAQDSVRLTTEQYRQGIVSYLNVVTAQTIALTDELTAIRGRHMAAAVLLVQALGGGWTEARLPSPPTRRSGQFDRACSSRFLRKRGPPASPPLPPPPKKWKARRRHAAGQRREVTGMGRLERVLLMVALSATVVLGGCAALAPAPYNGRESCQGVGGIYTSDGRCIGGNA
jgi:hypothetical protein